MKEILNKKIKFRESFRPFAPVVPLEFTAEYFEVESNVRFPFMSKVIKVKSENIPAVTHKDFTARL